MAFAQSPDHAARLPEREAWWTSGQAAGWAALETADQQLPQTGGHRELRARRDCPRIGRPRESCATPAQPTYSPLGSPTQKATCLTRG